MTSITFKTERERNAVIDAVARAADRLQKDYRSALRRRKPLEAAAANTELALLKQAVQALHFGPLVDG
jgi:hypothetical protein